MKIYIIKLVLISFSILAMYSNAFAQANEEDITVSLSSPGQRGTLEVDNHNGRVTIEGYSGNEILVKIISPKENKKDEDYHQRKKGLKKISMNAIDVDISEEDNYVKIDGSQKRTDFIIQVPTKFDLYIKTHHNGTVEVSNVDGEMEIIAHHGAIRLSDVSGSLVADTHHGEIIANFLSITDDPMAFSTYHGDVDITFPSGTNFDARIKSERGDIYTDFDVTMKAINKRSKDSKGGKKHIKIGGWMSGQFGAGGKEYLFNTYHGDVIIRKS